jgi:ABC-2 type transport system ATP-binding protein
MTDYLVETQGLTKRYPTDKTRYAIEDINLSIPSGQLFGLIGPDGAGKSTTLRILSTVITKTKGEARVSGFDVQKEAEKIRPIIGYMPQLFSLYPDLSVIENLNFFAEINQVPGRVKAERIGEMLSFTRLERFLKRRAGNLSGGMKKKLALACSLIHGPQILFLDEPSTGVDPVSRRELWSILADVVQQGVTIVVSTPYMDEAERCHQVGIIYQGKMLAVGAPQDLEKSLPFEVIEVKAKPRKEMRRVVSETKDILDWRPVGDRLRILAAPNKIKKVMRQLNREFSKSKVNVVLLRQASRKMEDVFVYRVSNLEGSYE